MAEASESFIRERRMSEIQQEKNFHPSDLCATHRFSSVPLTPVSGLGICSKVLSDRREPTRSLSLLLHALFLLLLPLPELTSLYLDTSDCFPTKGLLLIKKKKKTKQNIILPNHDVPHIHEEKKKKNQPPLPLLCSQRLGSILFPFVRGTTMEGLFSLCLTPEVLSQGMQMLLVPSVDGAL